MSKQNAALLPLWHQGGEGRAKGPAVWEGELTCRLWEVPGVRAQGPTEASIHAMTLEVTRTLPWLTVTAVTT